MRITIDEEWEHNGVTYWLQAEADVAIRETMARSEYFGTPAHHIETHVQTVDVRSWRVLGYDTVAQGYEIVLEEPRLLQAAKDWVEEHGHAYMGDA
jgi:hypothetical protein